MATTKYIWDVVTDNVMMEKDAAGSTQAVYTQEPYQYARLISQRRSGQTSYYHYDGNGNTRALTDESQNVTDTYTYTAFGDDVASTGTTKNRYRFGGQYGYQHNEKTGDYSVRERVYEPKRGRWRSKDPLRFADGVNRYAYSKNGAVNKVDPSGTLDWVTVRGAIPEDIDWGFFDSPHPTDVNNQNLIKVVGHCGAFAWSTAWRLNRKESDGLIIQKVCITEHSVTPCKGAKCTPRELPLRLKRVCKNKTDLSKCPKSKTCYFELWRVKDYGKYTLQPFMESPSGQGGVDTFAWLGCSNACTTGCTRGTRAQQGTAFFIPWNQVKKNRKLFYAFRSGGGGITNACLLFSACYSMELETELLKLKQGNTTTKTVRAQWDCCCTPCANEPCCNKCELPTMTYSPPKK